MTTQEIRKEVASLVAFELVKAERTKKWLAEKSGIPLSTLARKLGGFGDFTFTELHSIAVALNVSPSAFVPDIFSSEKAVA